MVLRQQLNSTLLLKALALARKGRVPSIGQGVKAQRQKVTAPDGAPPGPYDCFNKEYLGLWVADFTSQASILYFP